MAGIKDFAVQVPSPLVELRDKALERCGIHLYIKRDDLIHPDIPGNKWRKLKYNIVAAKEQDATSLLIFGGAYSNHIRATAAAGHYFGFRTIGVIRGEEHLGIGAGQCVLTEPDVFDQDDDGIVVLLAADVDGAALEQPQAVQLCPSGAFSLDEG